MPELTGLMKNLCSTVGVEFDEDRWCSSIKKKLGRHEKSSILVADKDGSAIGMAFASIRSLDSGFKFGYISNLVVAPEYRQQGLGELLVHEAIDFFRKNHITSVRVTVKSKAVEDTARFFYKLGFEEAFRVFEFRI
ncbi:MAG: GNAT family N-acetyltransferase [Promethearchaeota archaeon]